jgi:hypothetical protein
MQFSCRSSLQHISFCSAPERFVNIHTIGMLANEDDRQPGHAFVKLARRLEATHYGHGYVQKEHVWLEAFGGIYSRKPILSLADHLSIHVLDKLPQHLACRHLVVNDEQSQPIHHRFLPVQGTASVI